MGRGTICVGSVGRVCTGYSCVAVRMPLLSDAGGVVGTSAVTGVGSNIEVLGFSHTTLISSTTVVSTLRSNGITSCMASFPASSMLSIINIVTVPRLNTSAPRSRSGYTSVTSGRLVSCVRGNGVMGSMGLPRIAVPQDNTGHIYMVRGGVPGVVAGVANIVSRSNVGVRGLLGGSHNSCTCAVLSVNSTSVSALRGRVGSVSNIVHMEVVWFRGFGAMSFGGLQFWVLRGYGI